VVEDVKTMTSFDAPVIPPIEGVIYTVDAELGRGGGGEVWRVRSDDFDAPRALKRIRKVSGSGSDRRNERFRREIQFGVDADHPHVVRVRAQAEDDKYFYYVMDLYSSNLRDVIAVESALRGS
jgi:serine/threonine protein kinase